jgi:hypothetical protein
MRSISDELLRRAAISLYPGITNKLQNIFKKHKITIVYSNKGRLCDFLGNPEDKPEFLEKLPDKMLSMQRSIHWPNKTQYCNQIQ